MALPSWPGASLCAAWACGQSAAASARHGQRRTASPSSWIPTGPQGPGSHRYELTGVAGHAEDVSSERGPVGAEFVITAGDQAFVARTAGLAAEVAVSSRVTAQCTFSVVADYEWDAFGLPDLRTDWYVRGLAIEHRQIDDAPRSPAEDLVGPPGTALRSFEIERMSRWDDDRTPGIRAWYLLDLTPLRAP
jgi:hypothetical protein